MQLAHDIAPGLELHASTQMSITSAEGVRFAQRLGASRITLARELSLKEIRVIQEADRLRPRNLRPWRLVRRVLGSMLLVGSMGRQKRESRAMRPSLPPALRVDRG